MSHQRQWQIQIPRRATMRRCAMLLILAVIAAGFSGCSTSPRATAATPSRPTVSGAKTTVTCPPTATTNAQRQLVAHLLRSTSALLNDQIFAPYERGNFSPASATFASMTRKAASEVADAVRTLRSAQKQATEAGTLCRTLTPLIAQAIDDLTALKGDLARGNLAAIGTLQLTMNSLTHAARR